MRTSPVHDTCRVLLAIAACWLAGSAAVQAMPAIQHWQTGNGARVYYVPAPELPHPQLLAIDDLVLVRVLGVRSGSRFAGRTLDVRLRHFESWQHVLVELLGQRKGVLVEGVGIIATGSVTVELAYINYSSVYHALFIKVS